MGYVSGLLRSSAFCLSCVVPVDSQMASLEWSFLATYRRTSAGSSKGHRQCIWTAEDLREAQCSRPHHPALQCKRSVPPGNCCRGPLALEKIPAACASFRFSSPRPGFLTHSSALIGNCRCHFERVGSLGSLGSAHGKSRAWQQTAHASYLSAGIPTCQSVGAEACA